MILLLEEVAAAAHLAWRSFEDQTNEDRNAQIDSLFMASLLHPFLPASDEPIPDWMQQAVARLIKRAVYQDVEFEGIDEVNAHVRERMYRKTVDALLRNKAALHLVSP